MPLFVEQRSDQPTSVNQLLQLLVLRRLNLSSLIENSEFRKRKITLALALNLAVHRHGKGHTIGEAGRKQFTERKMSREESLPMIDRCQQRTNDQGHFQREEQRVTFQAIGDQGARPGMRWCRFAR